MTAAQYQSRVFWTVFIAFFIVGYAISCWFFNINMFALFDKDFAIRISAIICVVGPGWLAAREVAYVNLPAECDWDSVAERPVRVSDEEARARGRYDLF